MRTFYVGDRAGDDRASGRSVSDAWRSVARVNAAVSHTEKPPFAAPLPPPDDLDGLDKGRIFRVRGQKAEPAAEARKRTEGGEDADGA